MLETVSTALSDLKQATEVTWVLESGFDDIAVWRTIWEQNEHLVCRLSHTERLVQYQTLDGVWQAGTIADAQQNAQPIALAQTLLEIRKTGQPSAKQQTVTVQIAACAVRVTHDRQVRRAGERDEVSRTAWVVVVTLLDTTLEPWVLLTDWEVVTAAQGVRIFGMYRQRWGVEDAFKFTKECLGWEEVQLLDLTGIRTLVALAWVAAGFLYDLGITLDDETVQLLAKLGGWEVRPSRPPGKITLTRGLRRLVDMLTTDAILNHHYRTQGPFPAKMAAFLQGWCPDDAL